MNASIMLVVILVLLFLKKLGLFGSTEKLPPGPNTWQVLRKVSEFRKQPHIAFSNLAKVYGPIISLRLGGQFLIIASSAATAKEILKTQDRNFSGRFLPLVYYKIPSAEQSSVVMSKECNATWKFLRGMSQNFIFSNKSVESKAYLRKSKVLEMIVNLDNIMNSTLSNIISDVLVSRNVFDITREEETNDHENMRALVHEIVDMVSSSVGLSDLFPFMRFLDFRSGKKAMEIHKKMMHMWGDMVKERRSHRVHDVNYSARDFLDVLIDNSLTDDQIYVVFTELLIAGTDSSSITLVWLMVELIKNPNILRRLIEEVAKAFEGDMLINEAILTESKYLQACIKETLRFYMPGPFLVPHRAIEKCKIHEYVIPKDSVVLVNTWDISLDPEYWEDASRGRAHFEYTPFGAGRRMCPGFNLAFKSIQIVVASLVHYFDWRLPNGMDPTQIDTDSVFGTVLKKKKPLLLIPTLRDRNKMR
ncbi:hypothetical protein ACP275_06G154000 [Erythranthe tilingii]